MVTLICYVVGLIIIGSGIYAFFSYILERGVTIPPEEKTYSLVNLPADGKISSQDIESLVFSTRFRGYSQQEVDWVLDKLYQRIVELEQELGETLQSQEVVGSSSSSPASSSLSSP